MNATRQRFAGPLRSVWRQVRRRLPDRYIHVYSHARAQLSLPKPWAFDEAAVELFRAERRARGELRYPSYLYGMLSAARTAVAIGSDSFSVIEFGVAGGNGLRALEQYAEYIEERFPVKVAVFGLDSGEGLLAPKDPRDCGFALMPGEYAMSETELRRVLVRAELVLGPVEETIAPFMERVRSGHVPPVGFVAHDLDVFTGTAAALDALSVDARALLPRVAMYFDDLTGYPYTDEVGEWAAISHFNRNGAPRKIGRVVNLRDSLGGVAHRELWPEHFFFLHVFDHPQYNGPEKSIMPSRGLDVS